MKKINYKEIMALIDNKQFYAAEDILNEIIKKHPMEAKAHYFLGVVYSYRNETERSIKQYKKVISLDPNYADAYFSLGMI
jgi:Tfp pilus assembly protein PilF